MIYNRIIIKYLLKLTIAMAAVLAGLTNLSVVLSLSQRTDPPSKEKTGETVRLVPFMTSRRNNISPPEEPPPFSKPIKAKLWKPALSKPLSGNMNINIPLTMAALDKNMLKYDPGRVKLPELSNLSPVKCRYKNSNHRHGHMDFSNHCFDMNEVDIIPQALVTKQPFYPYRAKRLSINGCVTVRYLVDTSGEVEKVIIIESDPGGFFEQSVKKTVPGWKFIPGKKDGKPVRTWMSKTIEFSTERK